MPSQIFEQAFEIVEPTYTGLWYINRAKFELSAAAIGFYGMYLTKIFKRFYIPSLRCMIKAISGVLD
jgi:hypothetical protein